jgi:ribosomal protein S11
LDLIEVNEEIASAFFFQNFEKKILQLAGVMRVDAFLLQSENDFSAALFQKNVHFSQPGVRIGDGRSSVIKTILAHLTKTVEVAAATKFPLANFRGPVRRRREKHSGVRQAVAPPSNASGLGDTYLRR